MLSKIKKFLVKRKDKNIKIHVHKILHVHRICPRSFFRSPILQKWLYYVKFFFFVHIYILLSLLLLLLLFFYCCIFYVRFNWPPFIRLSRIGYSFRCSVTDKIKQKNEKRKEEKPLCRKIRTQFSVFPIFSQLWECRLKSIRGSSVKGRKKWRDKRFTFLDKTANSIWSDHCNKTRTGRK